MTVWNGRLLNSLPEASGARSYLVDSRGRVVLAKLQEILGKPAAEEDRPVTDLANVAGSKAAVRSFETSQGMRLGGIFKLERWNLTLVSVSETESTRLAIRDILMKSAAWTWLISLTFIFIAFLGARQVTRRMVEVTESTKRIARGDFDSTPSFKSLDEVGELASAVTDMSAQIQSLLTVRVENARKEKELETARLVQSTMFPKFLSPGKDLAIAGECIPASECGGDWWSHYRSPCGDDYVIIADATGHGAGAAMVTAMAFATCQSLFHSIERGEVKAYAPADVLRRLNTTLWRAGVGSTTMTAFVGVIPADRTTILFASAGHPFPVVQPHDPGDSRLVTKKKQPKRYLQLSAPSGGVLGMSEDFEGAEKSVELKRGDRIFLYTDGLTEEINEAGEAFGVTRFRKAIKESDGLHDRGGADRSCRGAAKGVVKLTLLQKLFWLAAFAASAVAVWRVESRRAVTATGAEVASLVNVQGEVLTKSLQELLWTEVYHDEGLDEGTVVATGETGGATLRMEDGTAIALSPKTQIRVGKGRAEGGGDLIVTVLKGKVKVDQKGTSVASIGQAGPRRRDVRVEKVKAVLRVPDVISAVAEELPVMNLSAKAAPVAESASLQPEPEAVVKVVAVPQKLAFAEKVEPMPELRAPLEPEVVVAAPVAEVRAAEPAPVEAVEEEPVIEWVGAETVQSAAPEPKLELASVPEAGVEAKATEAEPVEAKPVAPKPILLAAKSKMEPAPAPAAIEQESFQPTLAPDQGILGETLIEPPPPEVAVMRPDEADTPRSVVSEIFHKADPLLTAERYVGLRFGVSALSGPLVEDTHFIGVVGRVSHLAFAYDTVPMATAKIDGDVSHYASRRLMLGWSFNLDLPFTSEEVDVTPRLGIWTLDASLPAEGDAAPGEFGIENAPSVGLELGWTLETSLANCRLWVAAELGRQTQSAVREETSIAGYRAGADVSLDAKRLGGPDKLKLLGFYFYERVHVERDTQDEGQFRTLGYSMAFAGVGLAYSFGGRDASHDNHASRN